MYAVIVTGGKQYRVAEGDVLRVEKLDIAEGESVQFDNVLLVGDEDKTHIGSPYVKNTVVSASVVGHERGDKITIIKFRRRKNHLKHAGHRQYYTKIKITGIGAGNQSKK